MELTKKQIERQDFVDNSIFELLETLNPTNDKLQWDIEIISEIRNTILRYLKEKNTNFSEQDYYPFIEE